MRDILKGRPPTKAEYSKILKVSVNRTNQWSIVGKLVIQLMSCAALRESEVAHLMVKDLVAANGELHELIILDSGRAYNGKDRPILLNEDIKKTLEQYLALLRSEDVISAPDESYLGLMPTALLIINPETFKPFGVQKRGVRAGRVAYSSTHLNKFVDGILKAAKLSDVGITRKSLLRLYCCEAYKSDISLRDISVLSGFAIDSIRKAISMDTSQYAPIHDWFTKRDKAAEKRLKRMKQVRKWMFAD